MPIIRGWTIPRPTRTAFGTHERGAPSLEASSTEGFEGGCAAGFRCRGDAVAILVGASLSRNSAACRARCEGMRRAGSGTHSPHRRRSPVKPKPRPFAALSHPPSFWNVGEGVGKSAIEASRSAYGRTSLRRCGETERETRT